MPSFSFSYEYDGAGNRTKKINNLTSEVTTYTYDSANQLTVMEEPGGTTTFEWDAAGNLIAKHAPDGTTTFTWDYEDQLTQVAPPVGDPVNFTYNAMGQRIQKDNTRFIYDGVQLLQETDTSNQTLRTNTFTNEGYGDLVSEHDGTDSSFPTFDGQWSTDAIVDDTATVTDRFGYTAFGGEDSHTGSSTPPFRFVGRQSYYRDAETGLYLLGAGGNPNGAGRYYDPELGRFISRDPIGLAGGDANLYRYAGNNPIGGVDPSGLDKVYPTIKNPKFDLCIKTCGIKENATLQETMESICVRRCLRGNKGDPTFDDRGRPMWRMIKPGTSKSFRLRFCDCQGAIDVHAGAEFESYSPYYDLWVHRKKWGEGTYQTEVTFRNTGEADACGKCHWIQFFRFTHIQQGKEREGQVDMDFGKITLGKWFLDRPEKSIYYTDHSSAANILEGDQWSIFDSVTAANTFGKTGKAIIEFHTYLVCNGKLRAMVPWSKTCERGKDRRVECEYGIGEAVIVHSLNHEYNVETLIHTVDTNGKPVGTDPNPF